MELSFVCIRPDGILEILSAVGAIPIFRLSFYWSQTDRKPYLLPSIDPALLQRLLSAYRVGTHTAHPIINIELGGLRLLHILPVGSLAHLVHIILRYTE